jgi:predicted nucleic acid-binding protein
MNKQNNRILIDSSMWILAFKRNCPESIINTIGDLLDKDLVATCGIILLEILPGSKNEKEYKEILEEMEALHYLEANQEVWQQGAQLSFDLRRKGITIPTTDIHIASIAIYYHLTLLHADHHFELIAQNSGLKSKQITSGI